MKKTRGVRGAGRIGFLARKDEIGALYEQGYTLRSIYDKYEGKLNIGYESFARYANTYLPRPSWKSPEMIKVSEPEISEEERLHHEKKATEDMLNLCDELVSAFIDRQDWLPEKYGRLAGFVKGFSASEKSD